MAAQALGFCSNIWCSNSSLLQQPQQYPNKPSSLNFQHSKRLRPSSSLSLSSSSSSLSSNYVPIFSETTTYTNSSNNYFFNTNPLFTPSSQLNYRDNDNDDTGIAQLHQEDYYHNLNSLDFLDAGFSSLDHQILLADPPSYVISNEETVVTSTDHHQYYQQPTYCDGGGAGGARVVSPQSISARERRRKITERTSELGKLVPGGNRMSTAEMFQAAYKYVKFLQAQVSVLRRLSSLNQGMNEKYLCVKEMQVLSSPVIQEKLYSEEKCLVPIELLAKNQYPQTNSDRFPSASNLASATHD